MEAVRLWTEDAIADGDQPPPPRSAETLRADPEVAQALADGAALAIVPLLLGPECSAAGAFGAAG
jgi:hypothetical protein